MKRLSYGASITDMLYDFAKYAKTADSLALIWDTANDDPEELAKLEVITSFVKVCREMLDDINRTVNIEKPYYGAEEVPE